MKSSVPAWRRGLAAAAIVLLLGTGAAACGGEDKPAANDSTSADAGTDASTSQDTGADDGPSDDAGVKWAACMRENGIDVADPAPGENPELPQGIAQSLLEKAEKECGELPGSQQAGSGGLADDPKLEELALANQKCLRENGYEVPSNDNDEPMKPALPGENPVFDRANAACKKTGDALQDYTDKMLGTK
jgi:hypothetical protein